MRLLLLNPNTNAAMTATMLAAARRFLPPGVDVDAVTATFGEPVIATRVAYAIATHAAIEAYRAYAGKPDAIVLACFGDPGLDALREIADVPVIGLAEASFAAAGEGFAVVTLGPAWKPMLEEQVLLRAPGSCVGVWALAGSGLDMQRDPDGTLLRLQAAVNEAESAGASSIILGGVVLAGIAHRLHATIPFIDCLQAACAAPPHSERP